MTASVPIGSARVTVHADTDPFEREVERGVRKGAEAADDDLKATGKEFGDTLTDSFGDQIDKKMPGVFQRIRDRFKREKIKVKADVDIDTERGIGERISDEIEQAFATSSKPGGPVDRFGLAVADAVGSGFNISGRSPLIAFLIPLIGFIIFAVLALAQGVEALIATLVVLPALLISIGLQAGITLLAFKGMGQAIQGAFAAKNAKELKEAIKDLTPSAQNFVKELLPLRELFTVLQKAAQEKFFEEIFFLPRGIINVLGPALIRQVNAIAGALGGIVRALVAGFTSPTFARFIDVLGPSIVKFLDGFALAIATVSLGFTELGIATLPFFDKLGEGFNNALISFGKWLSGLSKDPEFLAWLDRMKVVLGDIGTLGGTVIGIIGAILKPLDDEQKVTGKSALEKLNDQLDRLKQFLESPEGQQGLKDWIAGFEAMGKIAIGLVVAFTFLGGVIGNFVRFMKEDFVSGTVASGIFVLQAWHVIAFKFWEVLTWLGRKIGEWIDERRREFWNWLTVELPKVFKSFADGAPWFLYQAGRNVIQGLINGLWSMFDALRNTVARIVQMGIRNLLPFSPAKTGPLSGTGDPLFAGQKIVNRLAAGIKMESPALQSATSSATSNIVFGPGSIQVGFQGVVPTPQQAETTGAAAGRGIMSQLALRDTRLQVRMAGSNG